MGVSHHWPALLGTHTQLCNPGALLPLLRGVKVTGPGPTLDTQGLCGSSLLLSLPC